MKKQSSRSQRGSKGIKVKHILQISVLLGVCIWLIYQVKYSHDKKKELYEKDGNKPTVLLSESEDGLVKLGRKYLLPVYHSNQKEKHVEEDEDEEEEKKQGDEVGEEDEDENKHEEDEIDEQEQSKYVQDTDKDDELLEEEKESGMNERDEKENETNLADDIDEAREEHYKADDASSAVSHESRILNAEKLKESYGNSTETAHENNLNATISEVKTRKELVMKLGEPKSSDFVDKTATIVKDGNNESSSSETKSLVTESKGDTVNDNLTEAVLEASGFVQKETEIMRNRSQEHDKTEDGADLQTVFKLEQNRNESDPNITVSANITNKDFIQDESRNSTSESFTIEKISGSNTTEVKENSGSEGDDESGEKESSNLFFTEQKEEADDTSETSTSKEEKEALTDPQTLPDIRIEDEEEATGAE